MDWDLGMIWDLDLGFWDRKEFQLCKVIKVEVLFNWRGREGGVRK